jgi:hypothetical protein
MEMAKRTEAMIYLVATMLLIVFPIIHPAL